MRKLNIPLQLRCSWCGCHFDITDKLNTNSNCPECDNKYTLEISYSIDIEEIK